MAVGLVPSQHRRHGPEKAMISVGYCSLKTGSIGDAPQAKVWKLSTADLDAFTQE